MHASTRTTGALVLTTLLIAASAAAPASAIPEPQPASTVWHRAASCALERIGAQPVRCDDLTGLGLPAPAVVPEQ